MRFNSAALAAASLFAAACAPAPKPAPAPTPSTPVATIVPDYSRVENDIIHLINVERIRNRLDTLVWNPQLDKAAKIQAVEMASERKMAHDLPGAPHPTLKDRAQFSGYLYRHLAENIAYGYPTATYAVGAWMNSPGHRANILDRAVIETGVGVARAKTGELYFCQVFGARFF
jgi:uncharacterized protein YkwD